MKIEHCLFIKLDNILASEKCAAFLKKWRIIKNTSWNIQEGYENNSKYTLEYLMDNMQII